MLKRRTLIQALLAATFVVGLLGFSRFAHWYEGWMEEYGPGWHAMAWPFLRDGFPPGRAWRNGDLAVYVRPKLGFCANCDTGVVDDSEVDQVTDVDLLDEKFTPVADGNRLRITDLFGRARLYNISTPRRHAHRRGHRRQLQVRPDRGPRGRQDPRRSRRPKGSARIHRVRTPCRSG